jgi:hypothetical protein
MAVTCFGSTKERSADSSQGREAPATTSTGLIPATKTLEKRTRLIRWLCKLRRALKKNVEPSKSRNLGSKDKLAHHLRIHHELFGWDNFDYYNASSTGEGSSASTSSYPPTNSHGSASYRVYDASSDYGYESEDEPEFYDEDDTEFYY